MKFTAATLDRFPEELDDLDLRTVEEADADADLSAALAYELVTGREARR